MSSRRFILPNHAYHTISVTRAREPVFTDESAAMALINEINYERQTNHAFVLAHTILPDHLHLLLVPLEPFDVTTVMHNLKSFSAKAVNKSLGRSGPVWQQSFFDRVIRDEAHLKATVEYIHRNAVTAGLVEGPEEYRWSSAHPSAKTDVERFFST